MLEDHYYLTITRDGHHYAEVRLPTFFTEADARQRALEIIQAICCGFPKSSWHSTLSYSQRAEKKIFQT
jgi:hypothetical protein